MKKNDYRLYGALLLTAAAALVGCSSDDGETAVERQTWQVTIPTAQADVTTRTSLTVSGTSMSAVWQTTDAVKVYKNSSSVGTLTPATSATSATLSGTLTGMFAVGNTLNLYWPDNSPSYTTQAGTLESISAKDYVEASVTVNAVDGSNGILGTTTATFSHRQSFTKFTFSEAVHSVVISATGMSNITVTAASGDQTDFYVALPLAGSVEYTFVATTATNIVYYGRKQGNLTHGRYYTASVDLLKELDVTATISSWGDGETLPSGDLPF